MKGQSAYATPPRLVHRRNYAKQFWNQRYLFLLLLPGLAFYIIYRYLPIYGISIAFKDYSPFKGILGSPWVGLKHFDRLFSEPGFKTLFSNTLVLAVLNLVLYFPITVIIALLLNEVRHTWFKRFVQSTTYLPHFLSWVVVYGLTFTMLNSANGVINLIRVPMGLPSVNPLLNRDAFRIIYLVQSIWRDAGWGAIVFLAALTGVDPQLYEASDIEGANRMQKLWYITLPSILPTVTTVLILRMGNFLNLGFEQIILLLNANNREVAEIFDTYVYRLGIEQAQFSYSTAVGLFKSIIGLVLVLGTDVIAKKCGQEGIL